ncbi:unnamed protein product [Amoebophrya sp. A25]|nr:unnamed protein product [Amoebophrya sp. A25]|eukprot:GSA25T00000868001.1
MQEEQRFLVDELGKVDVEGEVRLKAKDKELEIAREQLRQAVHKVHYDAIENEFALGNSPPSHKILTGSGSPTAHLHVPRPEDVWVDSKDYKRYR